MTNDFVLYAPEVRRQMILSSFTVGDFDNSVTVASITEALERLDNLAF